MSTPGERLLQTFEFVQIINLKSRSDRLREMAAELERIGLSLDHPQISILEASRFSEAAGFPSIGARGCFDSHLRALKAAQARGVARTLILEDDCNFARTVPLTPALDRLDQMRWSVFYGAGPTERLEPTTRVQCAHFIAFTRPAIDLLVPYLEAMTSRPGGHPDGGPMHVDGAYCRFRADHPHLAGWAAVPAIAYQRPSRTDIHDLRSYDRIPVLSGIVTAARRLKRVMEQS